MATTKSANIQSTIRATATGSASSLIRVPEIENDSTQDAIRKLQVQIFYLADALAELSKHVDNPRR
jgi:hypothetical protein